MKKGFTLIELLAVIVILAIIALIAVPIVINIINDSKNSSEEESLKLYEDAVNKMIVKKQMKDPSFNPSTCLIKSNGNLECTVGDNKVTIEVEVKGLKPNKGTITIEGNKVSFTNVEFNGKTYHKIVTLISDVDNDGIISYGDKYTYKVNSTDTFNFYVLAVEGDAVHLIMDRNICEDGTVATEQNKCLVAWYAANKSIHGDVPYGPETAMTYLYNATKEWSNVPDMIMNYSDEAWLNNAGYSIITDNGITTITGRNRNNIVTIGTSLQPLKARLPKYSEVYGTDGNHCAGIGGSCPAWLVNYLSDNATNTQESFYPNNELISGINGYWLLKTVNLTSGSGATYISNSGYLSYNSIGMNYGIRPVITVPKSDLE